VAQLAGNLYPGRGTVRRTEHDEGSDVEAERFQVWHVAERRAEQVRRGITSGLYPPGPVTVEDTTQHAPPKPELADAPVADVVEGPGGKVAIYRGELPDGEDGDKLIGALRERLGVDLVLALSPNESLEVRDADDPLARWLVLQSILRDLAEIRGEVADTMQALQDRPKSVAVLMHAPTPNLPLQLDGPFVDVDAAKAYAGQLARTPLRWVHVGRDGEEGWESAHAGVTWWITEHEVQR